MKFNLLNSTLCGKSTNDTTFTQSQVFSSTAKEDDIVVHERPQTELKRAETIHEVDSENDHRYSILTQDEVWNSILCRIAKSNNPVGDIKLGVLGNCNVGKTSLT